MPWNPSFVGAMPDPRLDPYRNRVAEVHDEKGLYAHLVVGTDFRSEQERGHLWWRRWGRPQEFAVCYLTSPDGKSLVSDFWVDPDSLEDELADWARNRFEYAGETYVLHWLSAEASVDLRRARGF